MQRCQVCVNEDVKEINKRIVRGENLAKMAQEYNLSYDSLYRHSREHVPRQLATGAEIALKNTGVNLMNELSHLMDESKKILKEARGKKHNGLALKAIAQIRGNLSLLAAIKNELFKQRQKGDLDADELREFRKWQAERADLGDQIRTLSDQDRELLRRAAVMKIAGMTTTEIEDFKSKSVIFREYGGPDNFTSSVVVDDHSEELGPHGSDLGPLGTSKDLNLFPEPDQVDPDPGDPDQVDQVDPDEPPMRRTTPKK